MLKNFDKCLEFKGDWVWYTNEYGLRESKVGSFLDWYNSQPHIKKISNSDKEDVIQELLQEIWNKYHQTGNTYFYFAEKILSGNWYLESSSQSVLNMKKNHLHININKLRDIKLINIL
jgi:hypothetical protein